MQIQNTPNYQNFQVPPPPPSFNEQKRNLQFQPPKHHVYCIKCGNDQSVSIQTFVKQYVSPVAALGILIGILPYFLLRYLLTTRHSISAPFCENCWEQFRFVGYFSVLFNLGFVVLFIASIFVGIQFDSLIIWFIGFILSIALFVIGKIYTWKVSPKFKKVDDKQVIISAPIGGDIVFAKGK